MKKWIAVVIQGLILLGQLQACEHPRKILPAPECLKSARTVYLTSPSGDEFGMFPLPEDKEALIRARSIIGDDHRLKRVFDPKRADMTVVVTRRFPTESIRAFANGDQRKCVWHLSERTGLKSENMPLARVFMAELGKASPEEATQNGLGH
jgi:hypothetical protein